MKLNQQKASTLLSSVGKERDKKIRIFFFFLCRNVHQISSVRDVSFSTDCDLRFSPPVTGQ